MSDPILTPEQLQALHDLAQFDPKLAEHVRQYDTEALHHSLEPASLRPVRSRWTAAELAAADFPEPKWAVPDLLPVGLSFLAGRPKLGKSWLGLQIAHAVGTGGRVFNTVVSKGKVIYLALEDSPRRLKKRMEKQNIPACEDIVFYTRWTPFQEGGLVELANEVTINGYTLVIVDTLSRAIGKADQLDQAEMTTIIGNLQQLATNADIAILLIDHHRKQNGFESNPIDDILGSTAKAAVADAALGLYREQGKHGATLKVTGRDLEEHDLALEFDSLTCCWQSLGAADDVREDSAQGDVMTAIRALAEDGKAPTTTRIAKFLSKNEGYISHVLGDLIATGKVRKGQKIGREQPYEPS